MAKSWRDLFLKSEETGEEQPPAAGNNFSFPVNNTTASTFNNQTNVNTVANNPAVNEVLGVYEKGLDSINMPGYDFYEFYKTINAAGIVNGEQVYNMAYQMAKTLDNTVSTQKLLKDAEFYISKINEVHGQYLRQGQQKLNSIQNEKNAERTKLTTSVEDANRRMMELQNEMRSLELDIKNQQEELSKVDNKYITQEQAVKDKLTANDLAHSESIGKLNRVSEGIKQFIKN